MSFTFNSSISSDKVFLQRKADVTSRWDPFYFRPDLVALEQRVQKVTNKRLRDFVLSMSGGATPSTREAEKHYTDGEDGIPFIRVQNLSTTGRLNLTDCRRITRATHESLLRRSRLRGGELLVKITGVGRMAVASVVPNGLEGNINQHIVAIRTRDKSTSEALAVYLNLDIAERLASRRSTGGTRPALDYPALLSLPVVLDNRLTAIMHTAVDEYEAQTNDANAQLATVDDIMLSELGIPKDVETVPTLADRVFTVQFSNVTGHRLNPDFHREYFREKHRQLKMANHPNVALRELDGDIFQGVSRKIVGDSPITLLKVKNITSDGEIDFSDTEPVGDVPRFKLLRPGDIITPFIGAAIKLHKFAEFQGCANAFAVDNNTGVIRINDKRITTEYLLSYLRSSLGRWQIEQLTGGGGVPFLGSQYAGRLRIVLPPHDIQERICLQITSVRQKVRRLRNEARDRLEDVKRHIENLILGEEIG